MTDELKPPAAAAALAPWQELDNGVRAYARASHETGVEWQGRSYRRESWRDADSINRALSAVNSCLYGVCHAAIISTGYSPALGFIHTGKMLSLVYDVADLDKTDTAMPVAFRAVAEGAANLETRVRHACRDIFHQERILQRIVPDIQQALAAETTSESVVAAALAPTKPCPEDCGARSLASSWAV